MAANPASPLVSVLMPAYNHEAYARFAVASVLAQTHANLELIVIDDASADGTWGVLQAFDDPRIRRHRHESNQGAHATLNEALGLARGDYVTILNSDDVYAPERIAACIEALVDQAADMLGTDIVLIDDDGEPITAHWWIAAFDKLKRVRTQTGDWLACLLEGNVFMSSSNFFFRRTWYDATGGFADLRYVLDYEWLLRGLVAGGKLAWLDRPLLSYRLHESNTIAEQPWRANLECAAMLRRWLPDLFADERVRIGHLASQWSRIEGYLVELSATSRHEALVAKEAELMRLVADRDAWIAERDHAIVERDRWIDQRDRWIAARDQVIAARDALIASQVEWLADRDRWIVERDRWIAERDALVAERDAIIAMQTIWVADRDRWIAERDALVAAQSGWIEDGKHRLAERDSRIAHLEAGLESALQRSARLEASTSYRIGRALTAPWRRLRTLLDNRSGTP